MSLISDVRDEIKTLKTGSSEIRKFTGVLTVVSLLFCGYRLYSTGFSSSLGGLLLITCLFLLIGLNKPVLLQGIYRMWMVTAFILGWFVSRLLIIFIFCFLVTPIGIAMRLFGSNPLDMNFHSNNETYWKPKKNRVAHYEQLY